MNSIFFERLKFKDRKVLHYTLLACIILLQILVIVIWYNETANADKISKAFVQAHEASDISNQTAKLNNAILQSQQYFNHYIENRDDASLKSYLTALAVTQTTIDSLKFSARGKLGFKKLLAEKNKTEHGLVQLQSTIDSIINRQLSSNFNDAAPAFKFNELNYNKVLDSIKTNTYIKVDNVARKGLMARLMAAFSGKVQIQKEQLNTVVTMQYKNKVITGTIEELLKNVILSTNRHYVLEFKKLRYSFMNMRQQDVKLIRLNNELLLLCNQILPDYTNTANTFKNLSQQALKDRYQTDKVIRNFTIVILIVLMLVISLVLFAFTRIAFEYEHRLTTAKEKIRQSLSFKDRIIGMVSHEIRSPLSILSIYSHKISSAVKDPEVKETFKSMEFTTNSLLLLSNQILEYSKSENHALELKYRDFNLRTEIEQIITSMGSLVESHGNKIVFTSNLEAGEKVCSDVAKIHQLFYNIIGNANKFTQNGQIKVNVEQQHISDYEINLNVNIADNGMGISKHDLNHIFESYYQGSVPEKTSDPGVGLGLNLCKEIIALFDGNIDIDSEVNKGTRVAFNLIISKA